MSSMNCPNCAQLDAVQKLSALVNTQAPLASKLKLPSQERITELVQARYPAQNTMIKLNCFQSFLFLSWLGVGALALLGIAIGVGPFRPGLYYSLFFVSVFVWLILGAIIGFIIWISFSKNKRSGIKQNVQQGKQNAQELIALRKEKSAQVPSRWNSMFYCSRCDLLFIPDAGVQGSPGQFEEILVS